MGKRGVEIPSRISHVKESWCRKDETKEILLVALLSEGTLIEGLPEQLKTFAKTFSQVIGGDFKEPVYA